jgi:hypothetical protein
MHCRVYQELGHFWTTIDKQNVSMRSQHSCMTIPHVEVAATLQAKTPIASLVRGPKRLMKEMTVFEDLLLSAAGPGPLVDVCASYLQKLAILEEYVVGPFNLGDARI